MAKELMLMYHLG